jgi:acetylornithine deacetylase
MNAPLFTPPLIALDTIKQWVGFASVSRDSNLPLIDWTESQLRGYGVTHIRRTVDATGKKANLFVTIPAGNGEVKSGGLIFSGHTDVVPVDGQPWDSDPFDAVVIGENLVGRGVCDMKGYGATALALVPEMLTRKLKRPLHLAFSYDEEVGCIGVRPLIDDLLAAGFKPKGCIVGEPTGMQVVIAHKGKHSYHMHVRGWEAHSSLTPLGVNAVEIAAEIVTYLKNMARGFKAKGPFDPAYDVPYTTVHTGVMHGGTALNIVPRDCQVDFEFRHLPADDPYQLFQQVQAYVETFVPDMQAVYPGAGIELNLTSVLPGFDTQADSEIAELAFECVGSRALGKVSFGTEASLFHQAGIPTVICGPGHIAQAHQPNEWVSLMQLMQCEQFLRRVLDRASV